MIVSIHQPVYMPWVGYMYKIIMANVFVILDDVQYSPNKASMQDYNYIKTPQGKLSLKVPVEYKYNVTKINEARTKDELGWKEKHLKAIELNYKKAPNFARVFPKLKEIMLREYNTLADLNVALIEYFCEELGIETKIVKSSQLEVGSSKEQRIIDIVKNLGGNVYLSGKGAKDYQDEEHFKREGIDLVYTDYRPIEYPQVHGEFVENLSVIDYLFNCEDYSKLDILKKVMDKRYEKQI